MFRVDVYKEFGESVIAAVLVKVLLCSENYGF